jgi:hypothetical protein
VIAPKLIKLSTGKLSLPKNLQANRTADDPNSVQVSWQKSSPWSGKSLRDELLVVSELEGQYSEPKATGLVRGLLGGSFELPSSPLPQAPCTFTCSLDQLTGETTWRACTLRREKGEGGKMELK